MTAKLKERTNFKCISKNMYICIIKQVRDRNSAYGDVTVHSAKITDNNPDYYYENWKNIERILNSFDILWNFCIWYLVQPAKWPKGKYDSCSLRTISLWHGGFSNFHPLQTYAKAGVSKDIKVFLCHQKLLTGQKNNDGPKASFKTNVNVHNEI